MNDQAAFEKFGVSDERGDERDASHDEKKGEQSGENQAGDGEQKPSLGTADIGNRRHEMDDRGGGARPFSAEWQWRCRGNRAGEIVLKSGRIHSPVSLAGRAYSGIDVGQLLKKKSAF